ncbi:DMT family transporter [Spirochaeta thermophila]|uniref:Putative transporter n=1 Tax=Winmispira thermophila (strain ATCC 49972 / DSM 6192 / RI 19.B1) TaxID=665571 RepID=E0RTS6_WINT6|nr:DMT family transporter [Spirochaeta thermophila]ADN02451.1 putative transporter [Spirochaeta thermophila DSM 6192]
MDRDKLVGVAAMLFSVVVWGISFVSTKIVLAAFGPMMLAFIRFAVGVVVLALLLRLQRKSLSVRRGQGALLIAGGVIGVTLYFYFENTGLLHLPASDASLIVASIPIVSLLVEAVVFRRGMGVREVVGALLSFAGVYLIVREGLRLTGRPVGYLLMAGAAASWVAYGFLSRPVLEANDRLVVVFWHFVAGTAAFLPFLPGEAQNLEAVHLGVIGHLLFLGVGCSALAYWTYQVALHRLGVAVANVFINLIPFVTVLTAMVVLGEALSPLKWVGGAVVIVSVSIALLPAKPKKGRLPGEAGPV